VYRASDQLANLINLPIRSMELEVTDLRPAVSEASPSCELPLRNETSAD
jgi:hypothetical protein